MPGKVVPKAGWLRPKLQMSSTFQTRAISWWVASSSWGCWCAGWEPSGRGCFFQEHFISQLPSWQCLVGQAVLTVDNGHSTSGDASSFQTRAEFKHILLWNFWSTTQNLFFLTVSPWGWDVELKRWSREFDLTRILYLPGEMSAWTQEGDLACITEHLPWAEKHSYC